MTPVFQEFIDFLKANGLNYPLKEGYFWLSRMIIRGYNIDTGKEVKILRIHIDDYYNITYSTYNEHVVDYSTLESWNDTAKRYKATIDNKKHESIGVIKSMFSKYKDYKPFVFHSGGKDSAVLYNLVAQVISEPSIIFNNTSNESAGTYKYLKSHPNLHIFNPNEGFWQYCNRINFIPSRFARGCCRIYKHDSTIEHLNTNDKHIFFMGMRNSESNNRKNYQFEHFFDYYPDNWVTILPIRKWTDVEVWLYLLSNNIPINDIYKKGYSRCGCIICPYRNNLEELITRHYFPHQTLKLRELQYKNFIEHERWISLNCTIEEFMDYGAWKGGVYREEPTQEVVDEFAQHKGISLKLAKQYFDKKCNVCNRNVRKPEVLSMNLKLNGRNTNVFYCKKHLQEHHNITHKKFKQMVESFKLQECELF